MKKTIQAILLAAVAALASATAGASTFSVTNSGHSFTISRSDEGGTDGTVTLRYRTVSQLTFISVAQLLPAYLDGADESVKTNWVDWATRYGAVTNAEYEGHFLLDIDPETEIPEGAELLRVVEFNATTNGFHMELASDVCALTQRETSVGDSIFLGNGIFAVEIATNAAAFAKGAPADGLFRLPAPVTVDGTTGRAIVDFDFNFYLTLLMGELNLPPEALNVIGFKLPGNLFVRPVVSPHYPTDFLRFFVPTVGPGGGEEPTGGYAPEGYSLVWSDEFDSGDAPSDEWYFENWGTSAEWSEDDPRELQYYCDDGVYGPTGQRTASVSDGTLKIKAYKIEPSDDSAGCKYVSARVNTTNSWQYGYVEMRAKLPTTKGCWPAFWMLPANKEHYDVESDPDAGEIDIMEYVPGDPWYQPDATNTVHFSAHSHNATAAAGHDTGYADPQTGDKHSYSQSTTVDGPGEWHCYGLEWTHDAIRGFIDGVQYFYAPNPVPDGNDPATWPFDQEFYIKLNLAIGGWGGEPADDFGEPTFEVDWVRVYQR